MSMLIEPTGNNQPFTQRDKGIMISFAVLSVVGLATAIFGGLSLGAVKSFSDLVGQVDHLSESLIAIGSVGFVGGAVAIYKYRKQKEKENEDFEKKDFKKDKRYGPEMYASNARLGRDVVVPPESPGALPRKFPTAFSPEPLAALPFESPQSPQSPEVVARGLRRKTVMSARGEFEEACPTDPHSLSTPGIPGAPGNSGNPLSDAKQTVRPAVSRDREESSVSEGDWDSLVVRSGSLTQELLDLMTPEALELVKDDLAQMQAQGHDDAAIANALTLWLEKDGL